MHQVLSLETRCIKVHEKNPPGRRYPSHHYQVQKSDFAQALTSSNLDFGFLDSLTSLGGEASAPRFRPLPSP